MLRELCLIALVSICAHGALKRKPSYLECSTRDACFPYSPRGPYCSRGNYMNFRFELPLAPENWRIDETLPDPIRNVTFAFCPRVDELMAFNFSKVGQLAVTYVNGTEYIPALNESFDLVLPSKTDAVYLTAIGFGDRRNINVPQSGSIGRVLIADWSACEAANQLFGIVDFLVLNISMTEGRFQYQEGFSQPAGSGFLPTCDDQDMCMYDSNLPCFGDTPGLKNCGRCTTDISELYEWNLQVWASFYGTDARGRQLRSGASNPMNFQAFSGSGVAGAMRRSFNNIQEGRTIDDDELTPQQARRMDLAREFYGFD